MILRWRICGKILFWYRSQNTLYKWRIIFTEINMYLIRETYSMICMRKVLTGMWMISTRRLTFVSKRLQMCEQQLLRVSRVARSRKFLRFFLLTGFSQVRKSALSITSFVLLCIIHVYIGRNSRESRADDRKMFEFLIYYVRIYMYIDIS